MPRIPSCLAMSPRPRVTPKRWASCSTARALPVGRGTTPITTSSGSSRRRLTTPVGKGDASTSESSLDDGSIADVLYQTPSRIEKYVTTPGWYTATYLSARVEFDRSGDIGTMLARMRIEADRVAHENTATAYDAYLNSFVRSIKSARHGDVLGQRLHAAESALALIRTLFGLESTWPPYHDNLEPALGAIEQAQGWPPGYLSMALSRLIGDADASFQQQLEHRVERMMGSRGIKHEWGDDLEPLKALRFDIEGSVV
jgi:hypothetical protein